VKVKGIKRRRRRKDSEGEKEKEDKNGSAREDPNPSNFQICNALAKNEGEFDCQFS
jgi:hypothetical protein